MCQIWTGSGNKQISAMVDSKITEGRTNNKEDVTKLGKNINWHNICCISSSCCRTLELEYEMKATRWVPRGSMEKPRGVNWLSSTCAVSSFPRSRASGPSGATAAMWLCTRTRRVLLDLWFQNRQWQGSRAPWAAEWLAISSIHRTGQFQSLGGIKR